MKEIQQRNLGIDGIVRPKEKDEEISQLVAQVLSTESGKEMLRYLRSITIEMVCGPNVSNDELRHREGQRQLVGILEARIAHAHRSKTK